MTSTEEQCEIKKRNDVMWEEMVQRKKQNTKTKQMKTTAKKTVRQEAREAGGRQTIFLQRWQRTSKPDISNLLGQREGGSQK